MNSFWKTKLFLPILLLSITLITYINILPNKLFFDDEELIYKNIYVQDFKFFPRYFTENMIAGAGKTSNMYRPILLTSFALDYKLWGNNGFGYHLTSIVLHFLNSLFLFLLIIYLFGNARLAILTSVFFIIHPVQVESVTYASGRTDPLYTLFGLMMAVLFLSFLRGGKYYKYFFSIILFILALLSKETAVIFPLIIIFILFLIPSVKRKRFKGLRFLIPYIIIDFIYIVLRLSFLNFGNTLNFYTAQNIYSQNMAVRLLTFSKVFFDYWQILIFPKDLIIARNAQIITSFLNTWVISFVLTLCFLSIVSIYLWKKKRIVMPLFCLTFFFAALLPVSGIIPINNIIAEHYLYLPSVSFFLFFSWLGLLIYNKQKRFINKAALFVILLCITVSLVYRSISRNFDWRDPITFYTLSLQQSPGHIPMLNNLAMAYQDSGKADMAIGIYKKIISTKDIYPEPHINLGNSYKNSGKYLEAEEEYKKAIKVDPNFIYSYIALYNLYQKTGEDNKLSEISKIIGEFQQPR